MVVVVVVVVLVVELLVLLLAHLDLLHDVGLRDGPSDGVHGQGRREGLCQDPRPGHDPQGSEHDNREGHNGPVKVCGVRIHAPKRASRGRQNRRDHGQQPELTRAKPLIVKQERQEGHKGGHPAAVKEIPKDAPSQNEGISAAEDRPDAQARTENKAYIVFFLET